MVSKYSWSLVVGHDKKVVMESEESGAYSSLNEIVEKLRFYEDFAWEPLIIKIERHKRRKG